MIIVVVYTIQDSKIFNSGKNTDQNEKRSWMRYKSTVHNLHSRSRMRDLAPVPRWGLKSIDPTQVPPGLTHTATGAIMIAPAPDESLR